MIVFLNIENKMLLDYCRLTKKLISKQKKMERKN